MRLLLSAALITSAANAEEVPETERYCHDLRQIVAAARERPAFRSLEARGEDSWLEGETWCRRILVEARLRWRCGISVSDVPEGRRGIARRVRSCLPEAHLAREDPEPMSDARVRSGLTRLMHGKTAIEIQEHGGPGLHTGWYFNLSVIAPR